MNRRSFLFRVFGAAAGLVAVLKGRPLSAAPIPKPPRVLVYRATAPNLYWKET